MRARIASYTVLVGGIALARELRADEKLACVKAADSAQEQRTAGKLRDARASLHICARDACPTLVRSDCTRWLSEVEGSMPTIVLRAEGPRGEDLTDVAVDLDGRRIVDKLEGMPVDVDPGPHTLTCRSGTGSTVRQEIVVHTSEKNRTVTLRVASSPAAPAGRAPPTSGGVRPSAGAWIFAGIAAAGSASFAYFGLRGSAEARDMRNDCAGHCSASRVDATREKLVAADISLGIALLSAGVATYLFWSAAAPSSAPSPARDISVMALPGSVSAVWLERF